MSEQSTKVVILGGGFGELYTAMELEKRLQANDNVDITLVSRENFLSFTPMLHEVAVANDLSEQAAAFRQEVACGVGLEPRLVVLEGPGAADDDTLALRRVDARIRSPRGSPLL